MKRIVCSSPTQTLKRGKDRHRQSHIVSLEKLLFEASIISAVYLLITYLVGQ